jgi:Cu2+-exporting ATPase
MEKIYGSVARVCLNILTRNPIKKLLSFAQSAGSKGQTVVYLLVEKQIKAAFALADVIRPESYEAIKKAK